ncbi:MAG: ABC transporter ATP-binding protein [Clostridia bacterium]|nr:ABC transporter ATP-binding protein [Clostridia bacterium]
MELSVQNIKKNYGKKSVLKDISFSAADGDCIGIVGGNGCGKSTLLSILSGVLRPDGGSFLCDGVNLFSKKDVSSSLIGYIPQNSPLIEELTAFDNLRLWCAKDEILKSLEGGVLNMLGINSFLKTPVRKMSGGMKKRLAIGCAVLHNPKVLLMDEPTSALDLACKEKIACYMSDFRRGGGIIILSTHDTSEVEMCSKLFVMKNGVLNHFEYDGNVHRLVGSFTS